MININYRPSVMQCLAFFIDPTVSRHGRKVWRWLVILTWQFGSTILFNIAARKIFKSVFTVKLILNLNPHWYRSTSLSLVTALHYWLWERKSENPSTGATSHTSRNSRNKLRTIKSFSEFYESRNQSDKECNVTKF